MQQLLANYFLQYKTLPLPSIGTLALTYIPAESLTGQNALSAPNPTITLQPNITSVENLLEYIALKKNISNNEATTSLTNTIDEIKSLEKYSFFELQHVGSFSKNESKEIIFTAVEIESPFFPNAAAIRVIHPNEIHSILVGENETNSAAMQEYYTDSNEKTKEKWWIFAVVAFVIATAAILYSYVNNAGDFFRNNNQIEINKPDSSYKKIP